jgi:hypothetical protein
MIKLDTKTQYERRQAPNPDADECQHVDDHLSRKWWRLILAVFLPFAAGYYLSFLFRTINASISPALASEFGPDAAKTGLLASVYFLVLLRSSPRRSAGRSDIAMCRSQRGAKGFEGRGFRSTSSTILPP